MQDPATGQDETAVLPERSGWGAASRVPPEPAVPGSAPHTGQPQQPQAPPGHVPYPVPESVRHADRDREARTRIVLIVVAVVAGLILVAGLVTAALTRPSPVTTTTTITQAPSTTAVPSTSAAPPTSVAPTTAAAATTTTVPPLPAVNVAVSPPERTCSADPSENTAILSWSTSEADGVVVTGPGGTVSSERNGSRTVNPSLPCEDVPPEGVRDVYRATGRNATGTTEKQATVLWLPAGTVGD